MTDIIVGKIKNLPWNLEPDEDKVARLKKTLEKLPQSESKLQQQSENDKSIGSLIKWIRKIRKMTLKQVSEKSGYSISYLSDLERGRCNPSINALTKICEAVDFELTIKLREK